MAIRAWNVGQLAVVWVGGLFADFLLWMFMYHLNTEGNPWGIVLAVVVVAVPFVLLGITWMWFGGRSPRK